MDENLIQQPTSESGSGLTEKAGFDLPEIKPEVVSFLENKFTECSGHFCK